MHPRRRASVIALPLLLTVSGCGYVHVGKPPQPTATVLGDETLLKENSDLRLEKKLLQQELALSRAQGQALRTAIENRAADGDTSKRLAEKLNETSKELAALRSSYAQLQAERASPASASAEAAALRRQLGETEEKLASSLRNFTQLQEEIGRLKSDVARTRDENLALTAQVRTITAQNEQAQAALAQLNVDLLAQKDARFRAEQDAATLRTELKAVAPNASALAHQRTGAAADARSIIAEHAVETAVLKQQLEGLQARVDALGVERAELTRQLAARTAPSADLAHLEAQLETARRHESALREENVQLKSASAELTQQLAQAAAGAAAGQDIRAQLRQTQARVAALTEENSRLKTRLSQSDSSDPSRPEVASAGASPAAPSAPHIVVGPSGIKATLVTSVPGASRTFVRTGPAGGTRVHIVSSGDTLAKISDRYYGTPGRWNDILAANRDVLGESNNLVIGRSLRIP